MEEHDSQSSRPLSEISHLFLTNLRDKATGGQRPSGRTPPKSSAKAAARAPVHVEISDATPEPQPDERQGDPDDVFVTALIAGHLNGNQHERAREFCAHLAHEGRVGLVCVDDERMTVTCFDSGPGEVESEPLVATNKTQIDHALGELIEEIRHWVVLPTHARQTGALELLREMRHWTLLLTCDHDGVVSAYRTLKTLNDLEAIRSDRVACTLGLLDAPGDAEADRVHQKLVVVSRQFLKCPLDEAYVRVESTDAIEQTVLETRPGQVSPADLWACVRQTFAGASLRIEAAPADETRAQNVVSPEPPASRVGPDPARPKRDGRSFTPLMGDEVDVASDPAPAPSRRPAARGCDDDVIGLPQNGHGPRQMVEALLERHPDWATAPVPVNKCESARLVVNPQRELMMIAACSRQLPELRSAAEGYRWLLENRQLIAMALPQFGIDAHAKPRLVLLIDQHDASADALAPLLETRHVEARSYRLLRWGGRTGLLLDAA